MPGVQLDCSACKQEQSMEAAKVKRFGGVVRLIGYIIAIPSAIGVIIAIIGFLTTGAVTQEAMSGAQTGVEEAGVALGAAVGFGFNFFLGIAFLVGGLVGWLLLLKRKVYKCGNCGFILDRA